MSASPFSASISVAIVSKGRPLILAETLESLSHQTLRPASIVVVVPSAGDLPPTLPPGVETVVGPLGASTQRNAAIQVIPLSVDYVAFFDDDMEFRDDYLACAVAFMESSPGVVGCSGTVLGNGNITREHGKSLIANYQPPRDFKPMFRSSGREHSLHGCNMILRRGVLEYERFDEQLPLYSFNEDYDLSNRLEGYGLVGRFDGCVSVHLESPSGRVREDMRGYSLVANNYYFIKKGTSHLPTPLAWIRFWPICVIKPLLRCVWHLARGDKSMDFRGRIRGILLAVKDIFAGTSHPGRIRDM
jgi:GT2 family glycosyltransferase